MQIKRKKLLTILGVRWVRIQTMQCKKGCYGHSCYYIFTMTTIVFFFFCFLFSFFWIFFFIKKISPSNLEKTLNHPLAKFLMTWIWILQKWPRLDYIGSFSSIVSVFRFFVQAIQIRETWAYLSGRFFSMIQNHHQWLSSVYLHGLMRYFCHRNKAVKLYRFFSAVYVDHTYLQDWCLHNAVWCQEIMFNAWNFQSV